MRAIGFQIQSEIRNAASAQSFQAGSTGCIKPDKENEVTNYLPHIVYFYAVVWNDPRLAHRDVYGIRRKSKSKASLPSREYSSRQSSFVPPAGT